jgi:hypothetical protein
MASHHHRGGLPKQSTEGYHRPRDDRGAEAKAIGIA